MEDNYKKILELLKEEDADERNKLVGLIEDFHKHHQSIYERYDHITGELRAKVHSKKDKDSSSSSSSDSDSDAN
nr:COP1-interactive protein 1 [Tanacetum cinerariifolium]